MTRIPKTLREDMAHDPFYTVCCITGERSTREDRIEWHHHLIYAGKQVQKKFAILPIKHSIHEKVHLPEIRERLDWIMLNRASDAELLEISRVKDMFLYRAKLNRKFGTFEEGVPAGNESGINYGSMLSRTM